MAYSDDLAQALRKLLSPIVPRTGLAAAKDRPPIVAAMGVGTPAAEAAVGGGIASPLSEVADTRAFHDHDLTSSDGLFVFEEFIPSSMEFLDAEGNDVQINYDNPYD